MFETNSKFSETTPNGLSVILVKFEDHRSDFRIICSLIPLTLSTPCFVFQIAVAVLCDILRNIGAMLHQKWQNMENTESSAEHSTDFSKKS